MTSPINMPRIIAKKRDGEALSSEEIREFIQSYSRHQVPDYQAAAMLMAIYLRGMTETETVALTEEMLRSGTTLTWEAHHHPVVDKHSTGGVGDKTSLIIAPLLAAVGCTVPMISGRGLGATGGTLDKLESIPGFRTQLSVHELQSVAQRAGCAMAGATASIAPADRKLYALRDVTATVASIPLITASILSKKLAEGLDALVLDVKWGSGAFMQSQAEARRLAQSLVDVGNRLGLRTRALLTDMNQPLGRCAGNAIEVNECLEVLNGQGPDDLKQLSLHLAAHAWSLVREDRSVDSALTDLSQRLENGEALKAWQQIVKVQGGTLVDPLPVYQPHALHATESGYIEWINTQAIGEAVVALGGGRRELNDEIDPAAGVTMHVRLGAEIKAGEPLVWLHAPNHARKISEAEQLLRKAFRISRSPTTPPPLIVEVMDANESDT